VPAVCSEDRFQLVDFRMIHEELGISDDFTNKDGDLT
jgi:hypothetical protein